MKNTILRLITLCLLALCGAAAHAQSGAGTALSFNGANAYVTVPGYINIAPATEVTVEFWMQANTVKFQAPFCESVYVNGSVFAASVPYGSSGNGTVYWDFGNINTGGRLSYALPSSIVGTWQHFAFVASQSGNYMQIYQNGVLVAQKAGMTPLVHTSLDLTIGGYTAGIPYNGLLDEFRIWNVARTQAQIQANMNYELSVPQPNLVAYWRFDEGSGNYAYDSSGDGNTGTLENGPLWVNSTAPIAASVTPPTLSIGSAVNVSWPSLAGHAYNLLSSTNVSTGYTAVEQNVFGTGGQINFFAPTTNKATFYRLQDITAISPLTNWLPSISTTIVNSLTNSMLVVNTNNPYDFVGALHNQCMDYFGQRLSSIVVTNGTNGINLSATLANLEIQAQNFANTFSNGTILTWSNLPPAGFTIQTMVQTNPIVVLSTSLSQGLITSNQFLVLSNYINTCYQIGGDYDSFISLTLQYENAVVNAADLTNTEKTNILSALAVSRYSAAYWLAVSQQNSVTALRWQPLNSTLAQRLAWGNEFALDDMLGALYGAQEYGAGNLVAIASNASVWSANGWFSSVPAGPIIY